MSAYDHIISALFSKISHTLSCWRHCRAEREDKHSHSMTLKNEGQYVLEDAQLGATNLHVSTNFFHSLKSLSTTLQYAAPPISMCQQFFIII